MIFISGIIYLFSIAVDSGYDTILKYDNIEKISMEDITEKRKHSRIKVNWPILIEVGGRTLACKAMNISSKGLYIHCEEQLPIDEIIYLSLAPEDHESIEFYGKVIWANLYGLGEEGKVCGFGVLFVQTSKIDSKQYDDLVKSLMSL